MKTLSVLLSTAGLAGFGVAVPATAAHAATTAPAASTAASCPGAKVIAAGHLRRFGGSPVVGSVQLKRDSCSRHWGELTMYYPLPQHAFATAYLIRYQGGTTAALSCASVGGSGRINPGGTTCRTPLITDTSGQLSFVASGHEYNGGHGWARVSWGQTAKVR